MDQRAETLADVAARHLNLGMLGTRNGDSLGARNGRLGDQAGAPWGITRDRGKAALRSAVEVPTTCLSGEPRSYGAALFVAGINHVWR
jgi:hypothetical protein